MSYNPRRARRRRWRLPRVSGKIIAGIVILVIIAGIAYFALNSNHNDLIVGTWIHAPPGSVPQSSSGDASNGYLVFYNDGNYGLSTADLTEP